MRPKTHMRSKRLRVMTAALALTLALSAIPAGAATVTVNVSRLNVRSQPGTGYPVVTVVRKGERLQVLKSASGGWIMISVDGGTGYVFAEYTTASDGAPDSARTNAASRTGTVTASLLNVRNAPSASAGKVGTARYGTALTVLAQEGGWLKIDFNGSTAYVSAAYVRLDGGSSDTGVQSSAETSGAQTSSPAVTLRQGSTGAQVKALQQTLIRLGFLSGGADGIFGPATKRAVTAFQSANGLAADGIAGPATLAALRNASGAASGSQAAPTDASSSRTEAASQSGLAAQAVEETNRQRAQYGLAALAADADLMRAAQTRAEEIARLFDHTRPDGSGWYTVSARAAGENIACGSYTAAGVVSD